MFPKIVIIGRPNVGKSSLMNLLARRRVSIVDPTAGVTRDRITTEIEIPSATPGGQSHRVELIDTGGYGVEDVQELTADIERQIARGLAEADLVLFVIDAQSGVVTLDRTVAKLLRTSDTAKTPVLLIANKVDDGKFDAQAYEAAELGFGEPVLLSATTGYRKHDLYERIRALVDFEENDRLAAKRSGARSVQDSGSKTQDSSGILIAMIGKRNAGKSTLVNALAGEERVIVSEKEGTTRDSVDVRFEMNGRVFTAIDTAGVRKQKSLADDIEFYSYHRSLRSIRRADVCLLLIDAAVPVSQVDKQLGNELLKHHRPTVVVVNKWDLAEKQYTQEEYVEYLDKSLGGLNFAPIVFISAKAGEGLREVVAMAMNLHEQAGHRISTSELNTAMETIMAERGPSSKGGRHARVYYATQLAVHPPTIALFVNDADLFDHNYERFLMNRFRDLLPFSEVPIKLIVRGKERVTAEERRAKKS